MVECDGLENRYVRKGIEGSNPSLSVEHFKLGCVDSHSQAFLLEQPSHHLTVNPTVASHRETIGCHRELNS